MKNTLTPVLFSFPEDLLATVVALMTIDIVCVLFTNMNVAVNKR